MFWLIGDTVRRADRRRSRLGRSVVARSIARRLWRRGQHGWPARYPLVQLPNLPLLAALAGWLVAALTDGPVHDYARATSTPVSPHGHGRRLEDGDNLARRVIGAAGIVYVIVKIAEAIRT